MRRAGAVCATVITLGLALPALTAAQRAGTVHRIGFLYFSAPPTTATSTQYALKRALEEGLRDFGYEDGRNCIFEYRWADLDPARIPTLAVDLVRANVHVIVTTGDGEVRAAKTATGTIPIVMAVSGDPVGAGYVASLARPGGNVTGMSYTSPDANVKLLSLFKETVPALGRVAVVWNAANPVKQLDLTNTEQAARRLGLAVHSVPVRSLRDVDTGLAAIGRSSGLGIVTLVDEVMNQEPYRRAVLEFATRYRLPVVAADYRHVDDGALLSYGPSLLAMFRRVGFFVDKILKGASPATLPVEQPRQFELVLNRKTAALLGVTIPPSVRLQADRVIE